MNEDVKSQNQSHNQPHQMNINEWRKLGEALAEYDKFFEGDPIEAKMTWEPPIAAAARQTYDRWQECGECEGAKTVKRNDRWIGLCPSCGGSGVLPNRPIDYEAAAKVARELTSLLPVEFEGSHDATVWALNIIDAALPRGNE